MGYSGNEAVSISMFLSDEQPTKRKNIEMITNSLKYEYLILDNEFKSFS